MNLPPLEYLLECSEQSLGDLELAALNRADQCLKRAKIEMAESVAERECAGIARWLIDNRKELLKQACLTVEGQQATIPFPQRKSA